VWLTELSRGARKATLDEIPDAELDRIAEARIRLGVVAERLANGREWRGRYRERFPELRKELKETLPI